jgi:hypothetical protein
MVNDVAFDSANPLPGRLYNAPSPPGDAGFDVYAGCYDAARGHYAENVTVDRFLAALAGNASGAGGGPVLHTTSRSRVLVNLVDHGGAGLFAFPREYLYADQLGAALADMSARNLYRELVLYVEACESGSLFEALPRNLSIYAVSASSPDESSWGTHCPGDPGGGDVVGGVELLTCLGDLFSVSWMGVAADNCSAAAVGSSAPPGLCQLALQEHFARTALLVNLSTPMQWGDPSFLLAPIGGWLSSGHWPYPPSARQQPPAPAAPAAPRSAAAASSRNASRLSLERRAGAAGARSAAAAAAALAAQLAALDALEAAQAAALRALAGLPQGAPLPPRQPRASPALQPARAPLPAAFWHCYRSSLQRFERLHGRLTDFTLGWAYVLHQQCSAQVEAQAGAQAQAGAAAAAAAAAG